MTHDEIRTFVTRYVEAWERASIPMLGTSFAEDAEVASPMFHTVRGRASIEASFRDLFRALADWKFTVDDIVIDTVGGERAVVIATAQFTHAGDLFGFPGSGRRINNRTVLAHRFESGLIKAETRLYDFTGLMVQLGVLKAKGG
jgi:steroid delta-isomerase-like uncharacterized protein